MGIFKKPKQGAHAYKHSAIVDTDSDDEKRIQEQSKHILQTKAGVEDEMSIAASKSSAKSYNRKGFFKSQGKKRRVKKKRNQNNFQRLSTGCSTPLNAYEPPGNDMFFPEENTSGKEEQQQDEAENASTNTDNSILGGESTALDTHVQETAGLTSHVTIRQTKKDYKSKNQASGGGTFGVAKDIATKKPKGFQKLNDEESVMLSPAPPKGFLKLNSEDESVSVQQKPLFANEHQTGTLLGTNPSTEEQSVAETDRDSYEPPDFNLFLQVERPFSDITASVSSSSGLTENRAMTKSYSTVGSANMTGSSSMPLSTAESSSLYMATSTESYSNEESILSSQQGYSSSYSSEYVDGNSDKFSDKGSTEFRQFVFDKKFSRIQAVAVERSDSGVADEMVTAAAALTSKLQAEVIGKYSSPPRPVKESEPRLSLASETSKFPSPKFPTPIPKVGHSQALLPPSQSKDASHKTPHNAAAKISDDQSESVKMRGEAASTTLSTHADTRAALPPKAIETSCEFTVVSNMSATQATMETSERTEKSSHLQYSPITVPEGKEQDDPFHAAVLPEVDDTNWETDDDPFHTVTDKSQIKYQGGQIKKSNSADDALIASIKKATKREHPEKKPDPSPRAIQTSFSDSGLHVSISRPRTKTILEEVRVSSKKKRTPIRTKDDDMAESLSDSVKKLFSDADTNFGNVPKSPDYGNKPTRMSLDSVAGKPSWQSIEDAGTPRSRMSVGEKVMQIENKRRFSRNGSTPFSPRFEEVGDENNQQTKLGGSSKKRAPNTFTSPRKSRPGLPFSPSSAQNRPTCNPFSPNSVRRTRNVAEYSGVFSAASARPASESGPDSDELEDAVDALFECSQTKSQADSVPGSRRESGTYIQGALERNRSPKPPERWQMMGSGAASASGVPNSAIAASMLFQSAVSESGKGLLANEETEEDQEDDIIPDVPPSVHVADSVDAVSSITEEASSFYHKSFQLWSKTAHSALNSIQKGAFSRNPNQYRSEA